MSTCLELCETIYYNIVYNNVLINNSKSGWPYEAKLVRHCTI